LDVVARVHASDTQGCFLSDVAVRRNQCRRWSQEPRPGGATRSKARRHAAPVDRRRPHPSRTSTRRSGRVPEYGNWITRQYQKPNRQIWDAVWSVGNSNPAGHWADHVFGV